MSEIKKNKRIIELEFELLFLRINKKGIIESECYDCTFPVNTKELESHNKEIMAIMNRFETGYIRKVKEIEFGGDQVC